MDMCKSLVGLLLFLQLFFHEAVSWGEIRQSVDRLGYDDDDNVHTTRPLIGIYTVPEDGYHGKSGLLPDHPDMSYIAASYVKFVESAGARAVPLIYTEPEESLRRKFSVINGILFPGGDADINGGLYLDTAKKLLKWAMEANDNGDYFPVYGVCLGLEILSVIVAGSNILDRCPADKVPSTVQFVNEAAKSKGPFKWIPKDLLEKIQSEPLGLQNHHFGLKPATFAAINSLVDFFEVLTVTADSNGDMYVSALQGKKYPVTAVMFHPEKNVFEWNYESIPHSADAIRLTQSIANYVVSETRKSRHAPASREEEEELLINNYNSVFIGKDQPVPFEEVYYFV